MAEHRIIHIHAEAPAKPEAGSPCNGCGVCCATTLCPPARLRYLRIDGPCPALRWIEAERRYGCGLLMDAKRRFARWWMRRAIGAGIGCDCTIYVETDSPATKA
jgi:hypothetical protein